MLFVSTPNVPAEANYVTPGYDIQINTEQIALLPVCDWHRRNQ